MNLYINNQNVIYNEKPLYEEARKLSEEEEALYYRGYGSEVQEGMLVDISQNSQYLADEQEAQKDTIKKELLAEIEELDIRRIRAICEPAYRNDGQSWLDYYTSQIQQKRNSLLELN